MSLLPVEVKLLNAMAVHGASATGNHVYLASLDKCPSFEMGEYMINKSVKNRSNMPERFTGWLKKRHESMGYSHGSRGQI